MKSVFDQVFFSTLYSLSPWRGNKVHAQTRRQPLITKQNQVICVYWFCGNSVLLTYYRLLHGLKNLEKLIFFCKKRQTINEEPVEGIISHRSHNCSKERVNINDIPVTFTFIIALFSIVSLNNTWNSLIAKISTFHPFLLLTIDIEAFLFLLKFHACTHYKTFIFPYSLINFIRTSFKMYFWLVSSL